jgi:hypothetical protein
MAHRSVLGLYMGSCETQNTTAADIKSHTAAAWSFRYPGGTKNHRAVTTPITPANKAGTKNTSEIKIADAVKHPPSCTIPSVRGTPYGGTLRAYLTVGGASTPLNGTFSQLTNSAPALTSGYVSLTLTAKPKPSIIITATAWALLQFFLKL